MKAGIAGTAAFAATLLLAGCDRQPAVDGSEAALSAAPIPAELCRQAGDGLRKLAADGALVYDGKGNATMEEQAWLQLPSATRDQLARLLGFQAACASKQPPTEQEVSIRNEYGRIMLRQTVQTRIDVSDILGE